MKPPFRLYARSVFVLALGIASANGQRFPTTEESAPFPKDPPLVPPRSEFEALADRFALPRDRQAVDERNDAGVISIQQLRSPIKGKALKQLRKAEEAIHDNKNSEAVSILSDLLDDSAARPYALCLLGSVHLKLAWKDRSHLDRALRELEEGASLHPADAATQSNLALALGLKGDLTQATKHGEKSLQLNPGEPKSRLVLGWVLALAGRHDEAAFHLKIAAKSMQAANTLLRKLEMTAR